jgi:hypothetical protein
MRFRLFRHVFHGWILVFPLRLVSGGGFTLLNSNSATTVNSEVCRLDFLADFQPLAIINWEL